MMNTHGLNILCFHCGPPTLETAQEKFVVYQLVERKLINVLQNICKYRS